MISAVSHRLGLAACVALAVLYFGDAFFGGRTVVPTGFLDQSEPWASLTSDRTRDPAQQYDLLFQFYPWAQFLKESVTKLEFPLWNPYNYLGTPFFANPQTAVLFPLTWLHIVFPLHLSFTLIFTLKLALSLAGMFLHLRNQGLGAPSSFAGAVIYGLSMHTVVSLAFPYSNVTILLPWLLLAVSATARTARLRHWCLTVGVSGLIVLAGQPQSVLPAFLAAGLYALHASLRHRPLGSCGLRGALLAGTALLASLPLTAIQWVSSLEYVAESMVPHGPRIIKSGFPYAPGCFLNLVLPDFFGSHLRNDYWGFPGYHDTAFYASLVPLLLIPVALLMRRLPAATTFPAWVLVGLSGLVLIGIPPFEQLLDLPGFDLVRRNKLVVLLILGLAHLGAVAFERISGAIRIPRRILVAVVASWALLVLAGLWWFAPFLQELDPSEKHLWQAARCSLIIIGSAGALWALQNRRRSLALLGLLLVDLVPLSYPLNPRGTAQRLYPPFEAPWIQAHEPLRLYALGGVFPPNSGQVYAIQDVRGYDVMTPERLFRFMQKVDPKLGDAYTWLMQFQPDQLGPNTRMRRIIDYWISIYGKTLIDYMKRDSYWSVSVERIENWRWFSLLNPDLLLTNRPFADAPQEFDELPKWNGIYVLANSGARRARLYQQWVVAQPDRVLEAMDRVDLAKTVVVEGGPDAAALNPGMRAAADVRLVAWSSHRSIFETSSPSPGILVIFERFSPGWEARLDDHSPVPILPAHSIFRGVPVPPGQHRVEFAYRPRGFRLGTLISGVSLALLGIGVFAKCLLWKVKTQPSELPPSKPPGGPKLPGAGSPGPSVNVGMNGAPR